MKRIILATMALVLIFALCACGDGNSDASSTAPQGSTEPSQTPAAAPSQNEAEQEPDGRGDTFDEQAPEGADELTQGVYYYNLAEISGDYGDGLSPREGAVLVNDLLTDMGLYVINGLPVGQCIYISLDELAVLDSAMGRECYIYSVGVGTPEGGLKGDDYQVAYRMSVDYSGKKTAAVYEDFAGGDAGEGRGNLISSEPAGEVVSWQGTYVNSGYSVEIGEADASSFHFVIRMITTTQNTVVLEGRAEIDETGFFAESGDMGFSLRYDICAIDISAPEGSEWADLRGQYEYIN